MNNNQGNAPRRPSAPTGNGQRPPRPQGQRPPQRPNGQPRPTPNGQRPMGQKNAPHTPIRPNFAPRKKKPSNEMLGLILAGLVVILVALIVIFAVISNDDKPNSPSDETTDPSVQAGINDPQNGPEWKPHVADPKAFRPVSDSSTVKLSASKIYSNNIIMVDVSTGKALCEYGADTRIYPASMTKIMTVIVACDLIDDMNETFTFTKELLLTIESGATNAYFLAGNPVPMVDLIYGAILPSGADACLGLSNALAGSEKAFVDLMNKKAAELGCTGTHFTNSIGLHDEDHYSTARDIATIMRYAMENPFLRKVLTAKSYKTVAPVDRADGTLYCSWNQGTASKAKIFGAKSGYTPQAGRCLASISKTANGREYIIVSAGAFSNGQTIDAKAQSFEDVKYLCDNYIK